MPYNVLNELMLFSEKESDVNEIFTFVKEKYPNNNAEKIIKENIEYVKRNGARLGVQDNNIAKVMREAIINNYADTGTDSAYTVTSAANIIDELLEFFVDKERVCKIYNNVKYQYPDINPDEFIRVNIEFAKKKEKKLKTMFLKYLEDVILKNSAGYTENVIENRV